MSSLRKQIDFYAQYHNNPVNILIHCTCVPIILWTAIVWFSYSGGQVYVFVPFATNLFSKCTT